jgi:Ras-related protein Rab-18
MSNSFPTFKILLIGDSGTGKSSLLLRFTDDTFLQDEMSATIGVDFKVQYLDIPQDDSSTKIKLTIWDTAGQERFRTLTSSYYRGAHGVILVYDVTDRETFTNLKEIWIQELDLYTGLKNSCDKSVVRMIVGNKVDMADERQVTKEEGLALAKEYGALFIESSAKSKQGVNEAFQELCLKIIDTPELWKKKEISSVDIRASVGESESCAC